MVEGKWRGFEGTMHDPGILVLTLNEPERMNASTQALKRDMQEILIQAQMDDGVRIIVITGSGRAFCAGDDLSGQRRNYEESQKLTPRISPGHRTAIGTYDGLRQISQAINLQVRSLDKVTIAAINGFAIQTGLTLALACDFRIASTQARLGSGTLRFAMQPDEGGHALLVQLIGLGKTIDFLLRAKIVSAEEALELGLVHEVVPHEQLMDRTMDLARELAEGPQVAQRLLKKAIYNAVEMPLLQAFDDIAGKTAISDHHPDVREGSASFREKRKPKFNTWLETDES